VTSKVNGTKAQREFAEHMSKADGLAAFRVTMEEVFHRLNGDRQLEMKARELLGEALRRQLGHVVAALAAARNGAAEELRSASS